MVIQRPWNTGDTVNIEPNFMHGEAVVKYDKEATFVAVQDGKEEELLVKSDTYTVSLVKRGIGAVGDFVRVSYWSDSSWYVGVITGLPEGSIVIQTASASDPLTLPLKKGEVSAKIEVLIPRT